METHFVSRFATFADLYEGRGFTEQILTCGNHPPLPPHPPDAFDRERLTVTIHGVEIDLRDIRSNGEPFQRLNAKLAELPREHIPAAWDEINEAAWEVFASRRFCREAFSPDGNPEDFDLLDLLNKGYHLDWEVGTYSKPSSEKAETVSVRPLFSIHPDLSGRDELVADGYLERGGSLLIAGQTGIGKSSLSIQFATGWAIGEPVLGFRPAQQLASLIVQAENGDNDVVKIRNGVASGFRLDESETAQVNSRVAVCRVDEYTGERFGAELTRLIRYWNPDVVFLDPLLAFVGGDISKQEVASHFLREILQPIIRRAQVGLVVAHHTGKPSRDPKEADQQTDYLALGSSELANWPRGIVGIRRDSKTRGLFRLDLGKRGQNLNWLDASGERLYSKMIRHSKGGIFWEEVQPEEEAAVATAAASSPDTIFNMVPATGSIAKDALISRAQNSGIGVNRARGWIAELIQDGRLFEWRVPRPDTGPARHISRHPQPEPKLEQQPLPNTP